MWPIEHPELLNDAMREALAAPEVGGKSTSNNVLVLCGGDVDILVMYKESVLRSSPPQTECTWKWFFERA